MNYEIEAADGFPFDKVNAAKRYLYAVKPWWARFGEHMKIVPIYQPPMGSQPYGATMSTDRQFRLYIDRGYALSKPLHILAGALEHEFQMHTRNVFNRLRHLPDDDWADFANIAFHLEANGGMDEEQRLMEMRHVEIICSKSAVFTMRDITEWNVTAPPGLDDDGWVPRLLEVPNQLAAEEYVIVLKKSREAQEKRDREEEQARQEEEERQNSAESSDDTQDSSESEQDEESSDGGLADETEDDTSSEESDDSDELDDEEAGGDNGDPSESDDEDQKESSDDADSDSDGNSEDNDDAEPGESDQGDDSGEGDDPEGDQEDQGASSSDPKQDVDPEEDEIESDADNGAEDLSDGGESDGSEDSEPDSDPDDESDAEESDAKDTGSVGGNKSSSEKSNNKSDSKGDTGNASIADPGDESDFDPTNEVEGTEKGEPSEQDSGNPDYDGEIVEGDQDGEQDGLGEGEGEVSSDSNERSERVIPTAEIADLVDALKMKLDPRLWAQELENPTDELTKNQWKPEERDNEKPVDQMAIAEAMEMLEQDVTEANESKGFGLKPGNQIVDWVFQQQKVRGVDWGSQLTKLISSAYTSAKISGASDLSYSVRNPNQAEFGPILQGLHDYAPIIMVIQDVSGSMRSGKRQSTSMSAFTELCTTVLGRFNSRVTWVTVDSDVVDIGQASGWSKTLQRKWSFGFGGTKIARVLNEVVQGKLVWKKKRYPKPDITIIVTDCGFDWPEVRPSKKGKILIVSVETNMSNVNFFLPNWVNRKRELVIIR